MKGQIISCINHGTIVQVLVKTDRGTSSIPMDWRCFKNIVETEGNLKGREIKFDEDTNTMCLCKTGGEPDGKII